MSDEDTEPDDGPDSETPDPIVIEFEDRLEDAADALEEAETEADLDDVEATLDDIADDLEDAEIPVIEPDEDDEDAEPEDPAEDLEAELSDLRDQLEDQRGPYDEDVLSAIDESQSTISDTRWATEGVDELVPTVDSFLESAGDILDTDFGTAVADTGELVSLLDDVKEAVTGADLDADRDAETIADLLDATDQLSDDVDASTAWTDLEVRERLHREGFYEPIEGSKFKDFPPEWAALKTWEKRGNVEMVTLLLDLMGDTDFITRHCINAIKRMGDSAGLDPLLQLAKRRNENAVEAIGKIGDENGISALEGHADSDRNPELQATALEALGAIGSEETTELVAQQLTAESVRARSQAARSLAMIGDTRAIDPLADVLADTDEDMSVRASAAWALCEIATEEALEIAADYVDDQAYIVEQEASKAAVALDNAE